MEYIDFKYKCKKCGLINTIGHKIFINVEEKLSHACENCKNKIVINAKEVRKKKYNDFIGETIFVSTKEENAFKILVKNVLVEREFVIDCNEPIIYIGRGDDLLFKKDIVNDQQIGFIEIPDKFVSKKHLSLSISKVKNSLNVQLREEGSLNGTLINNSILNTEDIIVLQNNDVIQIGETYLTIRN